MNNQDVSAADTVASPNDFNWSITGDQRFGLSVKLSDALGDVVAGVSLAAGSGVQLASVFRYDLRIRLYGRGVIFIHLCSRAISCQSWIYMDTFLIERERYLIWGRQVSSLQAINSTSPSTLNLAGSVIFSFG